MSEFAWAPLLPAGLSGQGGGLAQVQTSEPTEPWREQDPTGIEFGSEIIKPGLAGREIPPVGYSS